MNIPQLLLTLPRPLLWPRSAYPLVSLLAVLAFASLASLPAQAAGDPPAQQRRLVLEVDMTRQGRVSNGTEAGQEQRRQHWRVALVFSNGGERTTSNPFDSRSSDAALTQAQRAQAQAGLGFTPERYRAAWTRLNALPQVDEISLMTHFSDADGSRGIAHQVARFAEATRDLPG
jgi:hypothetical protein